jgi:hypothetical protein
MSMLKLDLPPTVKQFAQREFVGESLKWAHQPSPGRAMLGVMAIWLFALPWTAFALFWEAGVLGLLPSVKSTAGSGRIGMMLFGLPFVLLGLLMMSAPFWAWRHAKNSTWVLTNKRLAIVTAGMRGRVTIKSIMPGDILEIVRTQNEHGIGSLKLVYQATRDSDGDAKERSDTIDGIADVRGVEAMIRELKATPR